MLNEYKQYSFLPYIRAQKYLRCYILFPLCMMNFVTVLISLVKQYHFNRCINRQWKHTIFILAIHICSQKYSVYYLYSSHYAWWQVLVSVLPSFVKQYHFNRWINGKWIHTIFILSIYLCWNILSVLYIISTIHDDKF